LASTVAKLAFERPRPPLGDAGIAPVGSLPSSWSFPSGHATTTFAAAVALGLLCPRLRVPALAVAAAVGVSRVYLGVHYAADVLAGAVLGAAIGALLVFAARRARPAAVARA
jgi:undecaprenyl-diphosphatase